LRTIEAKKVSNRVIGQRYGFSKTDASQIREAYVSFSPFLLFKNISLETS